VNTELTTNSESKPPALTLFVGLIFNLKNIEKKL
jgi:hypothetical protein